MKLRLKLTGMIRLSFWLLLLLGGAVGYAHDGLSQEILERPVTLSVHNQTMEQVLDQLEKAANVRFLYSPQLIRAEKRITFESRQQQLGKVLDELLAPQQIGYTLTGKHIVLKRLVPGKPETGAAPPLISPAAAPDRVVTGVVRDDAGATLPGVSVVLKGTSKGTTTDAEGRYQLSLPESEVILVFSSVGYLTQEIAVPLNRTEVNLTLASGENTLNEVVVTALGIKRDKKALAYATGEIKGSDLVQSRETNLGTALSAKVAGVQVTTSAAGMTGSSRVVIRGNSSLSGNSQPLYVIDGVPIDNTNRRGLTSTTFGTGFDGGDGISNVNPNDIESVTVLKGPNGAALYGQLGANGVIIITTKSGGRNRKTNVQYNASFSIGHALVKPDYQNEYGQGYNGKFTFYRKADRSIVTYDPSLTGGMPKLSGGRNMTTRGSWGPKMEGQIVEDMWGDTTRYSPMADPYTNFFRPEKQQMHTISVDGGSEKTNYYFSATHLNNEGFYPTNALNRTSVNLRLSTDVAKGLNLDAKVNYIRQNVNNRPYLGDDGLNAVYRFLYAPRSLSMDGLSRYAYTQRDIRNALDLGGLGYFVGGEKIFESNSVTSNPFWTVNNTHNEDQRDRVIGYIKLNYELMKGLNIQGRYGTDFYYERQYGWKAVGTRTSYQGEVYENVEYNKTENADLLLTYSKDAGDFSIQANAGANRQRNLYRLNGNLGSQLSIPGLYAVGRTAVNTANLAVLESVINSVYASASVGYKNYLFLDATARNDWSSTLPPQNSSYFYPSVGASLVVTDAFNIKSNVLDYAKIRSSWAEAGKSGSPYMNIGYYTLNPTTLFAQPLASYTNTTVDPNLKNELKRSFELGAEFRFLKNRIGVDVTYYHTVTGNQILPIVISESTGYNTKLTNAGKIENKGIELLLTGTPVQTQSGFRWDVAFNMAVNRNKVLELIGDVKEVVVGSDRNIRITATVGQPYGVLNSADYDYVRDANGVRITDDKGLPVIRTITTRPIGNANPKWTGGLTNTFSWKGFSLNTLLDIRRGGQIFSQGRAQEGIYGTSKRTLEGREGGLIVSGMKGKLENGQWTSTGQANDIATNAQAYWNRIASDKGFVIAEEFMYDASYVAVREIRLAYQLPSVWFKKWPVLKNASLAVYGRNLGYLERHTDGFSPENASVNVNSGTLGMEQHSLPMMRTFGLDLNLTF